MKFVTSSKIIPMLFIFLFPINYVFGQTRTSGGEGYFMMGVQKINIKNLNTILQQYNYPALDENYTSIGGSGYGIVNNFVIGGEGHGLIGS